MSRPYSQLTPAFALLALAACERSTADMIDEARKAADRNPPDVLHAKRLLDDVLERTANDVSPSTLSQRRMALLIRGDVFRTIGLLSAAESDFRSILEQIDPADAEILIRIATVLAERADDSLGDLDRAIRYAEKAALVTTDSSAQIAAGVAHYKRGAHKRLKLTQDLLAVIGAANAKQVLASVRDSMSVGESDPVAVASDRLLDKILEFKTVDTRVRVTDAIADVRADLRLARDFLFKAVEPLSREDSLTFEHILPLLSDTHDLESSLWIARLLLRDRNYWENPRIVDACASAIADSNAYAEAADVLRDYIERGPFEMMYSSKSLALRLAMESNNGGVLKSVVEAIRKKLKRDPNAKLVSRLLVMYDSVLDRIEGKDHKTVATALAAFISKRDPEFADLIAPAAILAAKEYLAVDMHAEALRMVEIGVSSDEENVELNAMRASLLCKLKGEPVTAGRNARNAIVRDPANVERYLPSLRQAAEMFLAKTGQSLSRVEEDAIVRGEGLPKGYSEGWLYYVFARDYLDLGNRSAAASCALEAIARDAEMTPALVVFGLAASGNGQLAEARDAFLRALDAMPADPGLLRRVCDSGAAPAETTLLLLSARPEVEGRVLLAESLFDRCDREHAIRVIEQVAMQASANDDALLSAARSLIEDSRKSSLDTAAAEVGKTLLRRVSQDPKSATLAAQASLELALLRGEDVENKETLVAIKRGREWVDEKSLLLTVDAAARRGYAKTAVEVLRPLAEIVSPAMRAAFLHRLGSFEYLTGNYKNAASAFDRQIAIEERYENSIFLALCLLRDGDLTGAREALNQLRADWGITPMDSRRAMLALLLQTELSPEEKMALKHMGKTPLEVLQLASLLRIHPLVAGDAAPLSNVAWSRSAAEFASKSPNVASALLRFSLALSTRNG
jgi:tetratricopeptide (TPR) repeat protein